VGRAAPRTPDRLRSSPPTARLRNSSAQDGPDEAAQHPEPAQYMHSQPIEGSASGTTIAQPSNHISARNRT
jgi:hypothetical protein